MSFSGLFRAGEFIFFFLLCFTAKSQSLIQGTVFDDKTNESLPFASVFINQTTLGTVTDVAGNFSFTFPQSGVVELVCSYVGYQTVSKKIDIKEGQNYHCNIKLKPLVEELKKIEVIASRDKEWEKQLKKFSQYFVGGSPNAKGTRILNPGYLEFKEEKKNGGTHFTATSSQPLEIENKVLGYHITYYLTRFEVDQELNVIGGRCLFRELKSVDLSVSKKWSVNRVSTFKGSLRHLLNAINEGRLEEEGFKLYFKNSPPPYRIQGGFLKEIGKSVYPLSVNNIVSQDPISGISRISFNVPVVEVHYRYGNTDSPVYPDVDYPVSWLEIKGGSLLVNKLGVVMNPADLFTYGAMSTTRISDLLPDDYSPQTGHSIVPPPVVENPVDLEEIYIHTNKGYFYPGEKIWYKAYVRYGSNLLKDSLSKVLHVELIDPQKKIVKSQNLKITSGVAWGDIVIPDTIKAGTYYIRAFTHWSLNFGQDHLFIEAVPILSTDQNLSITKLDAPLKKSNIFIEADHPYYKPYEKIELKLSVKNEVLKNNHFNLSISVTDSSKVAPTNWTKLILEDSWNKPIVGRKNNSVKFPVEKELTYTAQVENKQSDYKGITVMISSMKDKRTVFTKTDDKGRFTVTADYADSAVFPMRSMYADGKSAGTVKIDPPFTPEVQELPSINFTAHVDNANAYLIHARDSIEKVTLLREVVISEKRSEPGNPLLQNPDIRFEGKTLERLRQSTSSMSGFMSQFSQYLPGALYDPGSISDPRFSRIGSFGFISGTMPVSIFINGLYYEDISILNSLQPNQIVRVEVYKPIGAAAGLGQRGYGGALNFITEAHNQPGKPTLEFNKITLSGYATPSRFQIPDYSKKSVDYPRDLRTTIFWEPNLIDQEGSVTVSFYAADSATKYRIIVQGLTNDGKPLYGERLIDIK